MIINRSVEFSQKKKTFGWRPVHGMIPAKGTLANRHIGIQGVVRFAPQDVKILKSSHFGTQNSALDGLTLQV
jgi:hypothetical protein